MNRTGLHVILAVVLSSLAPLLLAKLSERSPTKPKTLSQPVPIKPGDDQTYRRMKSLVRITTTNPVRYLKARRSDNRGSESPAEFFQPVQEEPKEPIPRKSYEPQACDPEPSGTWDDTLRRLDGLTVRGMGLNQSQAEVEMLAYPQEVRDSPWGRSDERSRILRTTYSYGPYSVGFDRHGISGQVFGDGLERYGIPILARGDSGQDVERLLGLPSKAGVSRFRASLWTYDFDHCTLTVTFLKGRVHGFTLQARDFVVGCC